MASQYLRCFREDAAQFFAPNNLSIPGTLLSLVGSTGKPRRYNCGDLRRPPPWNVFPLYDAPVVSEELDLPRPAPDTMPPLSLISEEEHNPSEEHRRADYDNAPDTTSVAIARLFGDDVDFSRFTQSPLKFPILDNYRPSRRGRILRSRECF